MKLLGLITIIMLFNTNMILFDFSADQDLGNWRVVDDIVMGGRSSGNLKINADGNALFYGKVSLENNGGFSSIRSQLKTQDISNYTHLNVRLKGDGKRYQLRIKSDKYERFSYISYFQSNGEWQDIKLLLSDMKPTFRGRVLDIPNYPGETMEEIAFLISNKKNEAFQLEISKISLQ